MVDKFLYADNRDRRERHGVENLEMLVVGNKKLGLSANGTIHEFVVVGVLGYQPETPDWIHTDEVPLVEQGFDDGIGEKRGSFLCQYFLVLRQDFVGHTNFEAILQKIHPNLVIGTSCRKNGQQTIGVDYDAPHKKSIIGCAPMFFGNLINGLAIENALVPEAVGFLLDLLGIEIGQTIFQI